jgi:hypothetical protein
MRGVTRIGIERGSIETVEEGTALTCYQGARRSPDP